MLRWKIEQEMVCNDNANNLVQESQNFKIWSNNIVKGKTNINHLF